MSTQASSSRAPTPSAKAAAARAAKARIDRLQNSAFGSTMEFMGGAAKMQWDSLKVLLRTPPRMSAVMDELYAVGVKSFLIVAVAALAVGLVMSIQFGFGLARFGAKLYVPKIVTLSIVRELGPIFTALMMAGRVGAGIAAEVGSMKVTQQIDAIRALGTNPLQKIVIPKVIACIIAAPLLTILANFIGVFGGMLISSSQLGVSAYDYFFKSFDIITGRDVTGGLIKSVFFGFLIGATGCYYGMTTTGGTQGVGNSTTRAVVTATVLVLLSDFILTQLLWIIESMARTGGV
jgi:phospholipid/cholesterol/gamma-HCH transport system permease protein